MDLNELERRLPCAIPRDYVAYVGARKPLALRKRGFDPKTLCVLNLELRERDREGWTKDRFFLSGDGSGNWYFVAAKGQRAGKVRLWSHDPPGVEDLGVDLASFLAAATQENPIQQSVRSKMFCIARTDVVGESILEPISLTQWKKAAASCEGVRYRGYRSSANPFTGEKLRVEARGLAVAKLDTEEVVLQLSSGRIEGSYSPAIRAIARQLAQELEAKLVVNSR